MTKQRSVFPSPLANTGIAPISAAVQWGNVIFLSGFIPIDPATGDIVGNDIESQAEIVITQLRSVLEAAGSNLKNVLRLECFLREQSDFAGWNRVFGRHFPEEPPARITQVAQFVEDRVLIQVSGVAGIPGS